MKLGFVAEMPFSNHAGGIARGFHPVGDGGFRQRQSEFFRRRLGWPGIEFVSEPRLISSGHQSRASRTAIRSADITIGAANAIFREGINVGSGNVAASVHTNVAETLIVGNDDQNVWFANGLVGSRCSEDEKRQDRGQEMDWKQAFHGVVRV